MRFLLFALALPLMAQDHLRIDGFRISQAAVLAGAALDVHSSYGLIERNSLLGTGTFGHRQATLSLAITAGLVLAEGPLVRRYNTLRKPLTILNYVMSSIRFSVATRNSAIK